MKKSMLNYSKRIKWILPLLGIISIVSLVLFSCNDKINDEIEKQTSIDYELIGIEHNKGLDYVFDNMEMGCIGNINMLISDKARLKSINSVLQLAEKATNNYLKNESLIAKDNIELALTQCKDAFKYKATSSNLKSNNDLSNDTIFSPVLKKYLLMIQKIVRDTTLSLESSIVEINSIENIAIEKCDEDEMNVVLGTSAIARHSLEYWHENYLNWLIKFGSAVIDTIQPGEESDIYKIRVKNNRKDGIDPGNYAVAGHPELYAIVGQNGMIIIAQCPHDMVFDPDLRRPVYAPEIQGNNLAKWREIVDSDLSGAIGAGLVTWVVNFIPGVGQICYATAMLGGGVGASVGAGYIAFYKRY